MHRRLAEAVIAATLCFATGAHSADLPDPWVQFTAAGPEARAIVPPGMACPAATIDGAPHPTAPRGTPDAAYPVQVCALPLPQRARAVTVGTVPVAVLRPEVRRIVVLGDTGCRLKGAAVQDCDDPAAWPFAAVARRAALRRPDLVIHVGDYHYRETPCPAGRTGCSGSPWGDDWAVWQHDFFSQAAPLLAAAPWVVVRGNHELCGRGGLGWFRLLDPAPAVADCPPLTPAYTVHLSDLDLLVLDSADADDAKAPPDKVAALRAQAQTLFAQMGPHGWLLTHRPVWGMVQGEFARPGEQVNATLRAALAGLVPPGLDLVMSGHVHVFGAYAFGPARPPQLVVGNGGDAADAVVQPAGPGTDIGGLAVTAALQDDRHGYLVLDRSPSGWHGMAYGADDSVLARCRLAGRALSCQ